MGSIVSLKFMVAQLCTPGSASMQVSHVIAFHPSVCLDLGEDGGASLFVSLLQKVHNGMNGRPVYVSLVSLWAYICRMLLILSGRMCRAS